MVLGELCLMPRPVTTRVRAAARRNIARAQVSRIRTREPRSVGRMARQRRRGLRAK